MALPGFPWDLRWEFGLHSLVANLVENLVEKTAVMSRNLCRKWLPAANFSIVIDYKVLPRRAQRGVAATKAGMAHGPWIDPMVAFGLRRFIAALLSACTPATPGSPLPKRR